MCSPTSASSPRPRPDGAAGRARLRRGRRRLPPARDGGRQCWPAGWHPATSPRPWSASAATATSRSRSTAPLPRGARQLRSGRARATSSASTCSARRRSSRIASAPSSPRSSWPPAPTFRLDAASRSCGAASPTRTTRAARPPHRRAARALPPGAVTRPPRPARCRRRVLRDARRRGWPRLRHAPARRRPRRDRRAPPARLETARSALGRTAGTAARRSSSARAPTRAFVDRLDRLGDDVHVRLRVDSARDREPRQLELQDGCGRRSSGRAPALTMPRSIERIPESR